MSIKYTLLDMVQEILAALDSDEVSTITATIESDQIARIIRGCYYDLATELQLREHETLIELNASGDPDKPVLMTTPSLIKTITQLQYNWERTEDVTPNYVRLIPLSFQEFMERQRFGDADNIGTMDVTLNGETFEFTYTNDQFPTFYTNIGNHTFLFDSYHEDYSSTLEKSRTLCTGVVYPDFTLTDNFVPELDPSQFALLRSKAKSRAFVELKQQANAEAVQEYRIQKIASQRNRDRVWLGPNIYNAPRYGRRGKDPFADKRRTWRNSE